jgi:hypothetical protein
MAADPNSRLNRAQNRPPAPSCALRVEARIQLDARISEAKYRQRKLAAVLHGVTVQTLVEHAIHEFLTNYPKLLHSARHPRSGEITVAPAALAGPALMWRGRGGAIAGPVGLRQCRHCWGSRQCPLSGTIRRTYTR